MYYVFGEGQDAIVFVDVHKANGYAAISGEKYKIIK